MRGGAGFWSVITGLVVLHLLLHLGFGIGREAPDLLTVALLLAARTGGVGAGAVTGFLFGLLEDALSVLAFGATTLAMTVVGIFGSATRDFFVGESPLFILAYLFMGKWLRDLLQWFAMGEGVREPFVQEILVQSTAGAIYAALVGFIVVVVVSGGIREVRT